MDSSINIVVGFYPGAGGRLISWLLEYLLHRDDRPLDSTPLDPTTGSAHNDTEHSWMFTSRRWMVSFNEANKIKFAVIQALVSGYQYTPDSSEEFLKFHHNERIFNLTVNYCDIDGDTARMVSDHLNADFRPGVVKGHIINPANLRKVLNQCGLEKCVIFIITIDTNEEAVTAWDMFQKKTNIGTTIHNPFEIELIKNAQIQPDPSGLLVRLPFSAFLTKDKDAIINALTQAVTLTGYAVDQHRLAHVDHILTDYFNHQKN